MHWTDRQTDRQTNRWLEEMFDDCGGLKSTDSDRECYFSSKWDEYTDVHYVKTHIVTRYATMHAHGVLQSRAKEQTRKNCEIYYRYINLAITHICSIKR